MPLVLTTDTDPGNSTWVDSTDLPADATLDSLFERQASAQWGEATASEDGGGTADMAGTGLFPATGNTLTVNDQDTDADGVYVAGAPNTAANGGTFIEQDNGQEMTQGRLRPRLSVKGSISVLTDIRQFAGLSDSTGVVTADAPSANYIGFQFSSSRGDTNWQLVYDNATSQVRVDTGIAAAAGTVLFFEINYLTSTSAQVIIRDNTYSNILYTNTVTVPIADTTPLVQVLFLGRNDGAAFREINRSYHVLLMNRNQTA
jgi:hypothetical protein